MVLGQTAERKLPSFGIYRFCQTLFPVCREADSDSKYGFKIDGISHIRRFRRKKGEFMEALGVPTSRKN